VIDENRNLAVK